MGGERRLDLFLADLFALPGKGKDVMAADNTGNQGEDEEPLPGLLPELLKQQQPLPGIGQGDADVQPVKDIGVREPTWMGGWSTPGSVRSRARSPCACCWRWAWTG